MMMMNLVLQSYCEDNPSYEKHYELDKAVGLSRIRHIQNDEAPEEENKEEAFQREKERIKGLRKQKQEEEKETRERKRIDFEKILAEKRKKYEANPVDQDSEDLSPSSNSVSSSAPSNPSSSGAAAALAKRSMFIGKMPGRKKKEQKKEEEVDNQGISIKFGGKNSGNKKTSVLSSPESAKGSSGKSQLAKNALLERSQALLNAVKKRKEEQKKCQEAEASIDSYMKKEEEKARKAKQAMEEALKEEESVCPKDIPLPAVLPPPQAPVAAPVPTPVPAPVVAPVPTPVEAPVPAPVAAPVAAPVPAPVEAPVPAPIVVEPEQSEEDKDLALLGIEKPDTAEDKIRAPPPLLPTSNTQHITQAKATASAQDLGSIFYGTKQGNVKQ